MANKIFTPDCRDCKWVQISKHGREFDQCNNANVVYDYCDHARKWSTSECGKNGKQFTAKMHLQASKNSPIIDQLHAMAITQRITETPLSRLQIFIAKLFKIPVATVEDHADFAAYKNGNWMLEK